jgi:hypothetical protein
MMTFPRLRGRALVATILAAAFAVPLLAAQPAAADGSIVIRDFVLTHGIFEREPTGTTDKFSSSDGRGYAFARIANEGMPTQVSFVWYYGEEMHASIDMNIGTSGGWRTWSSVNLRPGNWRVKLQDQNGMVIAERSFMVEHSSGGSTTPSEDMNKSSNNMNNQSSGSSQSSPYGGWTGQHDGG